MHASACPQAMVSTLVQYTGQLITAQAPRSCRWRGRPVRLVDGTTVTLPDTQDNQDAYPQPRNQKPGLGFPICRVVELVCLDSGALLTDNFPQIVGIDAQLARDVPSSAPRN